MELTWKDLKEKTPALEAYLLEVARELGAEEAVMFDGSIRQLAEVNPPTAGIKQLNTKESDA